MSLVNITNFDQALTLLGLYEREVMKTGILDYPAEWPKPPSPPPVTPEPIQGNPTKAISEYPTVESSDQSKPITCPEAPSPLTPNVNVDNVDNLTVIVNEAPLVPNDSPKTIPVVPEIPELFYEAQREALLTEQEKERRLFYLFVQELERTGDLRKLPAVLHAPSLP